MIFKKKECQFCKSAPAALLFAYDRSCSECILRYEEYCMKHYQYYRAGQIEMYITKAVDDAWERNR